MEEEKNILTEEIYLDSDTSNRCYCSGNKIFFQLLVANGYRVNDYYLFFCLSYQAEECFNPLS